MKKIMIVEDDSNLRRGIAFAFEKDGYSVVQAPTLKAGKASFEEGDLDLVILDLGLPDGNGMSLCQFIREQSSIPIIMLTACDMETDEVAGLMAGADDYIMKPFSLSVLRARVEVALRRLETKDNQALQSGKLKLDTDTCKLWRGNEEIPISATEFRLLKYLMINAGQILSKEQILAALWDQQGSFVDDNTLSVNISRLRAKIEDDPKSPRIIKNVRGVGYVFVRE